MVRHPAPGVAARAATGDAGTGPRHPGGDGCRTGVRTGQVITTGTSTGLHTVQPGGHVTVEFGFGTAELHLIEG